MEFCAYDFRSVFHIGEAYSVGFDLWSIKSFSVITDGKFPKNIFRSIQGDENIFTSGVFYAILNKFLSDSQQYIFMNKAQIQLLEIMFKGYMALFKRVGIVYFLLY